MSDDQQFTPSDAAAISGVSLVTQRDWRRRGFLPAGDGGWNRPTLRELCRRRMMRALIECGIPVSKVAAQISQEFIDGLASQVLAGGDPKYAQSYAVIARLWNQEDVEDHYHIELMWDLEHIRFLREGNPNGMPAVDFSSILVIPLAVLADDMIKNMNQLANEAKK